MHHFQVALKLHRRYEMWLVLLKQEKYPKIGRTMIFFKKEISHFGYESFRAEKCSKILSEERESLFTDNKAIYAVSSHSLPLQKKSSTLS